jgi:hypothetical protein
VWDAEKTTYEGSPAVRLTYRSKDGEEVSFALPHEAVHFQPYLRHVLSAQPMYLAGIMQGYPGNVEAVVTYVLEDGNAKQDKGYLRVLMEATTDQAGHVRTWSQAHKHGRLLAPLSTVR